MAQRYKYGAKQGKAIHSRDILVADKYWQFLAVRIIIARLRRKGQKIPPASQLKEMAWQLVKVKLASIGFIRSGWLPALRRLARFSKYGRIKFLETGKQAGRQKGGVKIATPNSPRVIFWNSAVAKHSKHPDAVIRYGGPALEEAFRQETASMKKYMEDKMRSAAKECGIKTN